jgi:hypothetical protein
MSAGAGFDFNAMSISMGMNQHKNDGGGDGANEKDIFDFLFDTVGSQAFGKATKLTGIPNMEGVLNTGIAKPFETEGLQGKMINPMAQSFSAPGGFLYRMFSALIKNSAITDHTQGIEAGTHIAGGDHSGGGEGGGGGDYGGGSGGGGGGGDHSFADMGGHPMAGGGSHIEPMTVSYGGHTYEVANMSSEVLGNISPSAGTDMSAVRRGDIEIG